jgi:pyruvate formate lyase activating enzyme
VDYVAMDIKASKEKYKKLTKFKSWDKIERSIKILIESNIIYEFRTTLIDGFHDVQEFRSLLNNIKGSKKYSIGTFRNTHVLDPRFKNMRAFKPKVINKFAKIAENYVQKVNVY